jgi:catechol 2,3-dioxygenase-like lactoylglutathione lyase family enzyme
VRTRHVELGVASTEAETAFGAISSGGSSPASSRYRYAGSHAFIGGRRGLEETSARRRVEGSPHRDRPRRPDPMQMKLELVPLPVSDVDRSIAFYVDLLGFTQDFDVRPSEGVRVVQLTPEGSGCSVGFGTGLAVYEGEPGSVRGLHLVVEDVAAARAELLGRGVEVGEIRDFGGGVKGADFSDPDGNGFELQEMTWRKGAAY